MLDPIVELLEASRQVSASRPGSARRALREHEEILHCVEAGDAEGARERMRVHLANTARDIEAALGEGHDGEKVWCMKARELLTDLDLPARDLAELPDSARRFPDGAQYRVEIPSVEGPRVLEAVLDEAQEAWGAATPGVAGVRASCS